MSEESFFRKENRYCWGCTPTDEECEGDLKPVLVFSDGKPRLMDTGPEGMPFYYCDAAIESDEESGFRVEVVKEGSK